MLLGVWSRSFLLAAFQALASHEPHALQAPRDSARAVKDARSAQASFELLRRANLPWGHSRPANGCDGVIGRICYWSDESDDVTHAPPESPRIGEARQRLLDDLERAQRDAPGDDWIIGQRVRYLVEANRVDDAITTARDCAAEGWWCEALAGYALHVKGDFAAATTAFRQALSTMSESERCRWEDTRLLVGDALDHRLDALGCTGRDTLAARIWWVSTPFFLTGANDLRTEHLARMTRARMEERARGTMGLSWADDTREVLLRYGWDLWFEREGTTASYYSTEPRIAGHPGWPSFSFFASEIAVDSMTSAPPDAWMLRDRGARARYAPTYVKTLRPLPHQLALFRRGDSALVIAAFDLRNDTAFASGPLDAAAFVTPEPGQLWGKAATFHTRSAVLQTEGPWAPMLASIEVIAPEHRAAARARYGLRLPAPSGRVSVSDLLLYAGGDSTPQRLEQAAPRALTTTRVSASKALGLFWETYGVRPEGETLGVSLTIEETSAPLLRRAARVLHLSDKGSPLRVQWQEVPDRETRIASRAVSVDLARLTPGRYRVRLTVTPADGGLVATAMREIEVVR